MVTILARFFCVALIVKTYVFRKGLELFSRYWEPIRVDYTKEINASKCIKPNVFSLFQARFSDSLI